MFLQLDGYVQALGFYRDLIDVLKFLKRNPESFSNVQPQFEKLLGTEPGPNTSVYINWTKEIFPDLLSLEKTKNLPETEMIKTERFGEVSKFVLREFVTVELKIVFDSLTAYLKKWSEFE